MASPDDNNQNGQGPQGNPGLAPTTDFEKNTGDLGGVSDLFGLKSSTGDTEKPTGQTGMFTPSGEAPTSLFTPLPDDATPRTLRGRYRLVAQLGLGGMGVTYRAWDAEAGVPVVIKMPRKDVRNNPDIMDRFNREVRTMLGLSHEHIVPITDHGEEEGCPFVAMRFLPGGSLSEYRGKDEAGKAATLSPATLHFWLPGIARALDFMHGSGVLHRDVKPGNIFLDGFLKPFLGDFGIAKVVDDSAGMNREYTLTATRMAVGTPEYMAPELFRPATTPDGRVDQYALAVTVYEMLAGRKPFRGDSAHIIVEHASKDVPPLQEFCPDVPRKLADAVHKALSKSPEDRFRTCSEFAEALIAQAPPLKIDTSRARLLCPSCRAILRVSTTTAGKRGTCPKCKSPVAVADDLGSLWLSGEDRSILSVASAGDPAFAAEEGGGEIKTEKPNSPPTEPPVSARTAAKRSMLATAALAVGLLLGGVWGRSSLQSLQHERQQPGSARNSLGDESLRLSEVNRRLEQDLQRLIDELDSSSKESARLVVENRQLANALAAGRLASSWAAPQKAADVQRESLVAEAKRLREAGSTQAARLADVKKQRDVVAAENRLLLKSLRQQQGEVDTSSLPKEITNSVGMGLKLCLPGTLVLGESQVTLTNAFYMGIHEVTVREWTVVMGSKPPVGHDDNHPAERVTWYEALEFCDRLSERNDEFMEGRMYRLPTEAEWEYACRAGSESTWAFGDDPSKLGEYCWFQENSNKSQEVCRKMPNGWGLFDMHGNVWEWCSDWHQPLSAEVIFNQLTNPRGASVGTQKVLRGGSWGDPARGCRSAVRYMSDPTYRRDMPVGLRVAMDMVHGKVLEMRRTTAGSASPSVE